MLKAITSDIISFSFQPEQLQLVSAPEATRLVFVNMKMFDKDS